MKRTIQAASFMLLLALPLASAGCSNELSKNKTYPAEGKILLNGEPAAFVMIHFEPVKPNAGVEMDTVTKEDGTFQLRTYANDEFDGAVPGEYTVTVEPFDPIRAVGITVPAGAKPTTIPQAVLDAKVIVEIKPESNDLTINIP